MLQLRACISAESHASCREYCREPCTLTKSTQSNSAELMCMRLMPDLHTSSALLNCMLFDKMHRFLPSCMHAACACSCGLYVCSTRTQKLWVAHQVMDGKTRGTAMDRLIRWSSQLQAVIRGAPKSELQMLLGFTSLARNLRSI